MHARPSDTVPPPPPPPARSFSPPFPAVLFGLAILFVSLATAACFWMRFGRWASLLVSLVWLLNVLLCGGGAGGRARPSGWPLPEY